MSLSGVICHLLEKYADLALIPFVRLSANFVLFYIFWDIFDFFILHFLFKFHFSSLIFVQQRTSICIVSMETESNGCHQYCLFWLLGYPNTGAMWGQTVPMQTSSFTKKKNKSLSGHTWSNIFLLQFFLSSVLQSCWLFSPFQILKANFLP